VMNTHPYLRAYMAGIVVPTIFLLVALTVFCAARYVFQVPIPIERVIVFPMALVPNLFGVWNMLYVWLRPHRHLPIGFHGALLPFVLAPLGVVMATTLGFLTLAHGGAVWFQTITVPYPFVATMFLCAVIAYYLIWKYLVGFFNEVLGVA
ncbi:MAG: hypothetical protein L0Z53_03260, partial [Acidobacteriales bacterium]|nr:hypothetical protein [Terriglobales bacterium]